MKHGNRKKIIGAFVLLNCRKGSEKKVIQSLKQIKEIKEAQCIDGPHNIIIKLESNSRDTLHEIITWEIRKIEDINATYTLRYDEESDACKDF